MEALADDQSDVWGKGYKTVEENISEPTFADKSYVITKYGAKVNATAAVNQKAINKAINICSKKGGGRVIVPEGTWLTGAIRLQSNVNLVVEKGATLLFAFEPALYPIVQTRWEGMDCMNYSPLVYANGCSNVAITGEGIIDGNGSNDTWWQWNGSKRFGWKEGNPCQRTTGRPKLQKMNDEKVDIEQRVMGDGAYLRPQLINICNSDRVLIEGVTLLRSPFWVIHPLKCTNLTVRRVHVENDGPNGDGCDPESCDGVLIEDCYFHTGDDCIAIKSGRNNDGLRDKTPSKNIIVRGCTMADGHGGVVIGSEISGGCENVYVENCEMDSPNLDRVIRIKTNPCRGGTTDGVYVRNVKVGQCGEAVLKINLDYEPNEPSPRLYNPTVRNVYMENVTCQKSKYGVMIIGLQDATNVYNINVKNCRWDGVTTNKNKITGKVRDIHFDNYFLNGSLQLTEAPYKNYSEWMTASEMSRISHPYLLDFAKKPRWGYAGGIEMEAMFDTYKTYGNEAIKTYLSEFPEKMIDDDGNIATYKLSDYNLDQIRTGRFIYRFNKEVPREGNAKAVKMLFKQLQGQPRTNQGVWFHKQIYHDQVWLDGIYMGQPFYTMVAPEMLKNKSKKVNKIYDDAVDQILATAEKTYDEKTGLWRHAWDESRSLFWADRTTGQSAHTWGRAQGWFIMAIVEVLDVLPEDYGRRGELISLLQKVAAATVKYQDQKTGLWYDVMDCADREGNYFEATCSSMFAYSLLKGARKGYLDDAMRQAGVKAYNGIVDNFIKVNADSTISLTKCVSVSGLGPESNPRRDGSFEYYMSEPVRDNDAKGIGPFIWASLEMERDGNSVK